MTPDLLNQTVEYDKSIEPENLNYPLAKMINEQVWGQGFPAPFFVDKFVVIHQEVIGEKHLKCFLKCEKKYQAIFFNHNQKLPDKIKAVYSIDTNEFNGNKSLQIIIKSIME